MGSWFEITSDRALSASEFEYCLAELRKAVGQNGDVDYYTDEHHFHRAEVYAPHGCDMEAVLQIACDMCTAGCTVYLYPQHDTVERRDYLANFSYRMKYKH